MSQSHISKMKNEYKDQIISVIILVQDLLFNYEHYVLMCLSASLNIIYWSKK